MEQPRLEEENGCDLETVPTRVSCLPLATGSGGVPSQLSILGLASRDASVDGSCLVASGYWIVV